MARNERKKMVREIYCNTCAVRHLSEEGSSLLIRGLRGLARHHMSCDSCNEDVPQGAECFALSFLDRAEDYSPWEAEYIARGQSTTLGK